MNPQTSSSLRCRAVNRTAGQCTLEDGHKDCHVGEKEPRSSFSIVNGWAPEGSARAKPQSAPVLVDGVTIPAELRRLRGKQRREDNIATYVAAMKAPAPARVKLDLSAERVRRQLFGLPPLACDVEAEEAHQVAVITNEAARYRAALCGQPIPAATPKPQLTEAQFNAVVARARQALGIPIAASPPGQNPEVNPGPAPGTDVESCLYVSAKFGPCVLPFHASTEPHENAAGVGFTQTAFGDEKSYQKRKK